MSHKRVLQECSARVPQECPIRVTNKSVPQECPTRVSYKSAPQECLTRVSQKSECHTRCPTRVHKSVRQRCPKGMCPTRVSHKSVSYRSVKNCLNVCFRVVLAFGFMGSIFSGTRLTSFLERLIVLYLIVVIAHDLFELIFRLFRTSVTSFLERPLYFC